MKARLILWRSKLGVFQKTLRNMWVVVSFSNPVIALLAVAVVPQPQWASTGKRCSRTWARNGRPWLASVISIDAVTVLSGAVLTSCGGKRCHPAHGTRPHLAAIFLKENRRGANYIILSIFFGLCLSILALTRGDLEALAGVYTISFLAVMAFFAIGNFLLKVKRAKLPPSCTRACSACFWRWWACWRASTATYPRTRLPGSVHF
ncbi:MAG: amino acid permease [Hymenobacter sp.]